QPLWPMLLAEPFFSSSRSISTASSPRFEPPRVCRTSRAPHPHRRGDWRRLEPALSEAEGVGTLTFACTKENLRPSKAWTGHPEESMWTSSGPPAGRDRHYLHFFAVART